MRKELLALSVIAALCAFPFCGAARADAEIGKQAPAFTATTIDGKNFDLSALKGKVAIIHFWATWCAPCREEMPALEAVWRREHGKGLEVLAVSADRPRARADVDAVMKYFTFPAALLGSVGKNDFGAVSAIPVTYIVGKDGIVADIWTPDTQPLTAQALDGEVTKLLDAKAEIKPDEKPAAKTDATPEQKQ